MGRLLIVAALCLGSAAHARAQGGSSASTGVVVVVLQDGSVAGPGPRERDWFRGHGGGAPTSAVAMAGAGDAPPAGVAPERLAAFGRVEALLVEARARAAHLEEAEALGLLARALRIAESHADVPTAAAWIAEVQTAIGLVAAQAGRSELMEAALTRAATLDPRRVVGAAEARPEVVARARAIAREVATRSTGRFAVRCEVPGATVWLDDEEVGPCGVEVRASVGRHLLQVRAPGHVPYGGLVDVFAGERAPVTVALAPLREVAWARSLLAAAGRDDLEAVAALMTAPPAPIAEAWLVETAPTSGRALLTRCDDRGCAGPRRLGPGDRPERSMGVPRAPRRVAGALPEARAWLARASAPEAGPREEGPWYRRWYVWIPVGVVLAGVAAGATVAARPAPAQELDITIDFGDLGAGSPSP